VELVVEVAEQRTRVEFRFRRLPALAVVDLAEAESSRELSRSGDSGYVAGGLTAGTVADALGYGGAIAIVAGLIALPGSGSSSTCRRGRPPRRAARGASRRSETDSAVPIDAQPLAGAADAYDHHMGRYGAQLAAGLIDVAEIRPGQHVLDVGCGPGPLTRALSDRAANVAAVDPSSEFIEVCRTRIPDADARVGVAEQLPFPSGTFDATLAQLVVQLMDDRDAGVTEMIRVTRPGGIVAASVWDSTTMPVLRAFWDAALTVAPERAGAIDDGRRVGYERPDELEELWTRHGLIDVSTGELSVSATYESFNDLFGPFAAGTGHSGACYTALDSASQRRLRDETHRRLGEHDGPFTLTARAWWVRGNVQR
jgi:SAM-dependent methyltransferase